MVEGTLPIHTQISSKDFITFMLTLLKTKDSPEVQFKILTLIKKWGVRFENKRDILPNFYETYNSLMKNGVVFPDNLESTYSSYLNDSSSSNNILPSGSDYPDFSNFNISGQVSNKNTDQNIANTNTTNNSNKNNVVTSSKKKEEENNYGNVCLDLNPENYPKKYRKFVAELVTLLNYITLANVRNCCKIFYQFLPNFCLNNC